VSLMYDALRDVADERARQLVKWGVQVHRPLAWLAILTEEVGEVAKELADCYAGGAGLREAEYRAELVQVAAVAVAAIEALDAEMGR